MNAAKPFVLALLCAGAALSGCNRGSEDTDVAKLDNQILANESDPAVRGALEDQILVDPALSQQSNRNAVRPPSTPSQAEYPLPGGGGAGPSGTASAGTGGPLGECVPHLQYSREWVGRLPPAFAVLPGAKVTDAAGTDRAGCRSRVVTFTISAPPQRLLDHYRGRASSAGYSAQQQTRGGDQILSGQSGAAAYYVILTPVTGGTDVALITTGG